MVDNRFLEIEEVTKKNFKECLTYLCYIIDFRKKENEANQQQMRSVKLLWQN